jgi:hypothetical protein
MSTTKPETALAITQEPQPLAAFTVNSFCASHGIGRSLFYQLLREGTGPRIIKVKNKTIITSEAAAEWRLLMEEKTAEAKAAAHVVGGGGND